jgi:hypothetical protein
MKTKVAITVDGETKKNQYTVFMPKLYKYPHFNISPYTSTPHAPPPPTPSSKAIKTHIPGEIGKINNNLSFEKKAITGSIWDDGWQNCYALAVCFAYNIFKNVTKTHLMS